VIPHDFIQELLARLDIVEVVGRGVALRKAGANYQGLCPFHAEKTPSFTVSPTKQFYHCFGCGAHGSAIGFVMEQSGLSYVEAIGELAESVGLTVPQESPRAGQSRAAPDLLEILAAAEKFYRSRLRDSERAIEYLRGRGLTGETAARFGIGYAPEQWRGLEAAVPDYDCVELVTSGLVIEGEADSEGGRRKRYDRFRDRVMFPIRNPRGKTIGFGGRVLGSGEPKYLNSPETPVFSKGRELYGLFEGRDELRRSNLAIVVEGYMDVVMLAQHGVGNAVATLGTATTPEHVRKLLRLVDRVVFSFDGDAAGRKAAWRALEASLPQASDTKAIEFVFLPEGHDPDSFVRAFGAAGMDTAVAAATPLSALLIGELSGQVDLGTAEGRAHLQALARPLLSQLSAPGLRLQLIHRIAELARISVTEFERYLAQAGASDRGAGAGRDSARQTPHPTESGRSPARAHQRGPAVPDLERRVRLLSALQTRLAKVVAPDDQWLSPPLLRWIDELGKLPDGASLTVVCEAMRALWPDEVAMIEGDVARDWDGVSGFAPAELETEFDGALGQLRDRAIRVAIDALVENGMKSEADRQRYQELVALRRRT